MLSMLICVYVFVCVCVCACVRACVHEWAVRWTGYIRAPRHRWPFQLRIPLLFSKVGVFVNFQFFIF